MASVSGTKRASDLVDNDVLTHTPKILRVEHHSSHGSLPTANNDFSGSVKKKLADSKRTGQACDRCKVSAPSLCLSPLLCYPWVQCGAVLVLVLVLALVVVCCQLRYTPEPPRRILHVYRPGESLLHASHAEVSFATRRDGRAGSRRRCTGPYRLA